jgi:hypothetical protein
MLREIFDAIELLDDASNGATAFRDRLPDGDYSVEITPYVKNRDQRA